MPGAMWKMLSRRELLGFALAPLPVVGPVTLVFGIILLPLPPDSLAALQAASEVVFWSYVATVVFGLPIHLLLRSKQQTSLRAYLGLAVVAAIAVLSGLALVSDGLFSDWAKDNPFAFTMWSRAGVVLSLIFVAVACLCASVFWAVAVRRSQT
jgi:hypothetical protein